MDMEQFKKLWSELGLTQKATLGLGAVLVIVSMLALLKWSSIPTMGLLYGKVDPKEMGEIVSVLEENGVDYKLEQGGTAVFVPKEWVNKMRIELAGRGVPSGGSGVGFEIFDRTHFGISDFVQRTNYTRAIQGELARTIMEMQHVRSARVMVVMPENKLLVNNGKSKATASVFVDTGHTQLDTQAVNAIRFLVAHAVDGLLVDDVAVIDQKGHMLTQDLKDDPLMASASSQLKYRQGLETYFTQKIESMLGKVLGPDQVVARVSVEIETETITKRSQIFDPESQVIRSQSDIQDTHSTNETKVGVAPAGAGAAANPPNTVSTQDVKKNKTVNYEINQSTTEVIKAPGDIKKISASVMIAQLLDENGKLIQRTPEQIEKMKQMVANALGQDLENSAKTITIEELPFPSTSTQADLPDSSWMNSVYVDYGVKLIQELLPLLLGLIMLVIFFKMIKKAKNQEVLIEFMDNPSSPSSAHQAVSASTITPDMLNQLIQDQPEKMAAPIKNWVMSENSN